MTSQACRCCGRSLAEMTPIGSAGGLEYRHCACGNTRTTPALHRATIRLALELQSTDLSEAPELADAVADWLDALPSEVPTCGDCLRVLDEDGQCPDGCAQPRQCSCDGSCPSCLASEREARRAARRMAEADIG